MIYCQFTGQPVGAFTVDELTGRGLSVQEAMWVVMGIPLDVDTACLVALRSVDGFQVAYQFDTDYGRRS